MPKKPLDQKFKKLKKVISDGDLLVKRMVPQIQRKLKVETILENYKFERNKVTRDLMQGIYANNPKTLKNEFTYKLSCEIDNENEINSVVKNYRKMMDNTRREAVRMEKTRKKFKSGVELVSYIRKSFRRYNIEN